MPVINRFFHDNISAVSRYNGNTVFGFYHVVVILNRILILDIFKPSDQSMTIYSKSGNSIMILRNVNIFVDLVS